MKQLLQTLATVVLALASVPAGMAAQDASAPEKWKMSAEFSLTDQSGNKVLRLVTAGINVAHLQRDDYRLDASAQTRYGRSDGDLVALSHLATLAFDLRPTSAWSPFAIVNAERDEFKRLDLRMSTGAGGKYTFWRPDTGSGETSLSLALLHAYERIAASADPALGVSPTAVSHSARWSVRGRTARDVRTGVTLRHTTFFQPLWDEVADYLLRSETGMKVLLTERLALSIDYQWNRDARPPPGVSPDDRLLKTGLIIDF